MTSIKPIKAKREKYYISHKPKIIHLDTCEHYKEGFKFIKEKNVFKNMVHPFCPDCLGSTESEKQKIKDLMLTGNGSHTAICVFLANINQPDNTLPRYTLTTAEGTVFSLTFKTESIKHIIRKYYLDKVIKVFGYPNYYRGQLRSIELFAWDAWDGKPNYYESWQFIGYWDISKFLIVQRDYTRPNIASSRFEKQGYLPFKKFYFENTEDLIAKKKLWIGSCYKIIARRIKDKLEIKKAIPFASPYPRMTTKRKPFTPNKIIL